jgi:hypothetical protein
MAVVPAGAPGPDVPIATRYLGSTGTFLALDIILYVARMYTRIWPSQRLGMDDLTASLSIVSTPKSKWNDDQVVSLFLVVMKWPSPL